VSKSIIQVFQYNPQLSVWFSLSSCPKGSSFKRHVQLNHLYRALKGLNSHYEDWSVPTLWPNFEARFSYSVTTV